jgi:murein DD-endopeptidase MepM/ murein hydrolase activator NlpD
MAMREIKIRHGSFPRISPLPCLYAGFCALALFFFPANDARGAQDCGKGVELRLSVPLSTQGSLLLAELRSAAPLTQVKGEWDSREVPFWQAGQVGKVWRALVGVDLEKAAGKYPLTITAQLPEGEILNCAVSVAVRAGHFPTESLHVEKQFVEPNPEQAKRVEEEGQRLHKIFDTVTPERLWRGRFRVPLDGVTTGGNFGRRRILNGEPRSPHTGVDFPAPTGTLVHAAQRGRVVLADSLFFSGNTVIVDHGLGVYTFYGHLSAFSVKLGDVVDSGAVLGKVGTTGRVTGPHLHWGLTVNKARVNALQIVTLLGNK